MAPSRKTPWTRPTSSAGQLWPTPPTSPTPTRHAGESCCPSTSPSTGATMLPAPTWLRAFSASPPRWATTPAPTRPSAPCTVPPPSGLIGTSTTRSTRRPCPWTCSSQLPRSPRRGEHRAPGRRVAQPPTTPERTISSSPCPRTTPWTRTTVARRTPTWSASAPSGSPGPSRSRTGRTGSETMTGAAGSPSPETLPGPWPALPWPRGTCTPGTRPWTTSTSGTSSQRPTLPLATRWRRSPPGRWRRSRSSCRCSTRLPRPRSSTRPMARRRTLSLATTPSGSRTSRGTTRATSSRCRTTWGPSSATTGTCATWPPTAWAATIAGSGSPSGRSRPQRPTSRRPAPSSTMLTCPTSGAACASTTVVASPLSPRTPLMMPWRATALSAPSTRGRRTWRACRSGTAWSECRTLSRT